MHKRICWEISSLVFGKTERVLQKKKNSTLLPYCYYNQERLFEKKKMI